MRLIDADALYKRVAIREEQLEKALLRLDPIKNHEAWVTVNGALMERVLFRHEIMDALTIGERKTGTWIKYDNSHCECPFCHKEWKYFENMVERFNYCPNCGAKMGEVKDVQNKTS